MAKVGRPPKYETPEEMQVIIDDYFDSRTKEDPCTVSGLSYHLGFEDRESFSDYGKKDEFARTVKKAKLLIESSYEKSLRLHGRSGDIFALKNFGWKDKQEIDGTHNINLSADELSNDQLAAIATSGGKPTT
tara:strand:+ start:218 stop:613 length:396 start_codon:yes stop_codon:yes gene_type:complete